MFLGKVSRSMQISGSALFIMDTHSWQLLLVILCKSDSALSAPHNHRLLFSGSAFLVVVVVVVGLTNPFIK